MEPKGARVGARVRAGEHHTNRRATWHDSKVVGCYGGEEHGAFEVRCSEGGYRLF
jgi:tRNA U55 pseudouridine synthase TruB